MQNIDPREVAEKYNSIDVIWGENDKWHLWQKDMINSFITESFKSINVEKHQILNAGSAGNSYNLPENNILHIDIAESKISHLKNAIVADIHKIPLSNPFDIIICVGSVINYCDPIPVIKEFERLIKPNGHLILEFENSYTLELIGKGNFNKRAVLTKTFYNGKSESLWYFSESYIRELTTLSGFKVLSFQRYHIISPLIYRFTNNEIIASKFSRFDKFLSKIPVIKKFSSNVILHLIKNN